MRLPSLVNRPSVGDWLAPLVLALAVNSATGCENKAIGRSCDLLVDGGINKTTIVQGLECPSRICVLPAQDPSVPETDTGALCSAECSKDSDCSDGEGRSKPMKTGDYRCTKGFSCRVATEVGDFCCKKMCLCNDFLPDAGPGGVAPPASCTAANCKNVH